MGSLEQNYYSSDKQIRVWKVTPARLKVNWNWSLNVWPSFCGNKYCIRVWKRLAQYKKWYWSDNIILKIFNFRVTKCRGQRMLVFERNLIYCAEKHCTKVWKRLAHWNKSHWSVKTSLKIFTFKVTVARSNVKQCWFSKGSLRIVPINSVL